MPGVRDANAHSLTASVSDSQSSVTVNVEGSILLETPTAQRPDSTGTITINCANTEIPNTSQPQAETTGAINCATASNGNTYTPSVAEIFADPGERYILNPRWDGVDSVNPQAVTLPGGQTPSIRDVAGRVRIQNASHTCLAAMQDKGALELSGYPGTQPEPVIQAPDQILTGEPASFSVTGVAGETFAWQDSNGARGQGQTFTDTFPTPGSYALTLAANGAQGCHRTTTRTITVRNPPPPTDPPSTTSTAILACGHARVTLTDVAIRHDRVVLAGVAEPSRDGQHVVIYSRDRRVATTIVSHDGSFNAWAALPPPTIRTTNRARYQARIGGLRSLDLKLTRRLILEPPTSEHQKVTLRGQVLAPFTSPRAPIVIWQENATCTRAKIVGRITPSSNGHYSITLPATAGRHRTTIYRLSTQVQATATNPRRFTTFSLTEAVNLK